MINLFHLSSNTTGGWVTYAYHLTRSLEIIGETVRIFKVGSRVEDCERNFGYGLTYQNIDVNTARGVVACSGGLITAVDKRHMREAQLLRDTGAYLVVHDPTEFKNLPNVASWERVITIRPTVQRQLPKSVFIPHPYARHYSFVPNTFAERKAAVSISRIDFDKRTDIILDANRLLRQRGQETVSIRGFENRIYTRFHIVDRYPEWRQSVAHYAREAVTATKLCTEYKFMVDMSEIKGDGGGTQYTFLEAMDAGSICVLNTAWGEGEMLNLVNCIQVSHAGALADVVGEGIDDDFASEIISNSGAVLDHHRPTVIAPQYKSLYYV